MTTMHPITLGFKNRELEANYLSASFLRDRNQGHTAIIIGTIVYLIYGLLDSRFVPEADRSLIWMIRLSALTVPLIVYILSYSRIAERYLHLLLASVGLAAGIGLITMLSMLTVNSADIFYPGLVLATFYTYNFIGTRFVYALCVDISLFLAYNIIFGYFQHYPLWILASHDFFIVSANLIGGIAGYLNERQRRLLFLKEQELNRERQLHYARSLHDPLTGLPNRELLYMKLDNAVTMSHRQSDIYCAMFIDLDGFKSVNDSLGHDMGDQALCAIASRLKDTLREYDTVARLGGDEFFVIASGIKNEADTKMLGNKLMATIRKPLPGRLSESKLSASIGICMFPYPGMTSTDIISRADRAMYRAKQGGKNACEIASHELDDQAFAH